MAHTTSGRPREFDLDEAIQRAMSVFWDKGYAGSSLPDLLEGMKLTRGSLYKAFGGKKELFQKALALYADRGIEETKALLAHGESIRNGIRLALLRIARLSLGDNGRRGCLLVSAATEMTSQDDEIALQVKHIFLRLQSLYSNAIAKGQKAGDIQARQTSDQLAAFLVQHIEGMRVMGKVGDSESEIESMVDLAMKVLD